MSEGETALGTWPAVRTRPANLREVGAWPLLAGCVAVFLVVPAATLLLGNAAAAVGPPLWPGAGRVAEAGERPPLWFTTVKFLVYSPLVTWALLPPAAVLSLAAARLGLGGWLVAIATGSGAGLLGQVATGRVWQVAPQSLGTGLTPSQETLPIALTGMILAGAFWMGVRLARPELFRLGTLT